MEQKKIKFGYKRVSIRDLDCLTFSNMSFFDKWIPEGCELVQVQFFQEPGHWTEEPKTNYISIKWKEKE